VSDGSINTDIGTRFDHQDGQIGVSQGKACGDNTASSSASGEVSVSTYDFAALNGLIICLPPVTIMSTSVICSGSSVKMPIVSDYLL
jgi:hypothetical protein